MNPPEPAITRRDPGLVAGTALLMVYVLTLAPDVTFWDAGEFIAAAHSLGIPHPPGTPLYILLLNVWGKVFFFLPFATATNLFSAACTALAAALLARFVHRSTGNWWMAAAAAIAAGSMSSVWLNATETEVYAASLALGTLMLWAGDRAGRDGSSRFVLLLAYMMVLAVPLHLSALVAAPPAAYLAVRRHDRVDWPRVALLAGAFVVAMGVGRTSAWLIGAGAAVSLVSVAPLPRRGVWSRFGVWIGVVLLAVVAASAVLYMYFRARWDPAINQANPATWTALFSAIARKQYAVSPIWPREAPIWIQIANFGQYADWQAALSLGPTVMPSLLRTAGTLLFIVLGGEGLVHHWRADRRGAIAMGLLLLSGSLGVVAYLNMNAGPSIGWGILPDDTMREARERDYFYVFAFWAWGAWAGIGAIAMANQYRRRAWVGVLVAALPLGLNWRAVTRHGEPEASLPRAVAETMLGSVPEKGVLFVSGDNDSYPLWYAQQVLGLRRDVAVVTIPLLPTRWYRQEMQRRHELLTDSQVVNYERRYGSAVRVAEGARRLGRPIAASITLLPDERARLGSEWRASGLVYLEGRSGIDTTSMRTWAVRIESRLPETEVRPAIDQVQSWFMRVLQCPRQLGAYAVSRDSTQLDSACNYR